MIEMERNKTMDNKRSITMDIIRNHIMYKIATNEGIEFDVNAELAKILAQLYKLNR